MNGYVIGQGGDISARLYNKKLEIQASGKDYWKDTWRCIGWWDDEPVWRIEFQLRRRPLAEHGVESIPDLLRRAGALWGYLMGSWLRLTLPSATDATQSRWPLHPLWALLMQADWGAVDESFWAPARQDRAPGDAYLFESGLSGLTSYMAREGIADYQEAAPRFIRDAERFHGDKSHLTGINFDTYMRERAALKARQYNVPFPGVDAKRDALLREAAAAEYRKRKDGE